MFPNIEKHFFYDIETENNDALVFSKKAIDHFGSNINWHKIGVSLEYVNTVQSDNVLFVL